MKYKILLLLFLFPVFVNAQRSIDSLTRTMFTDLKDSWSLGVDSNSVLVDIRMFNKFKSLFDSSATVVDDFNAFYRYDAATNSGTYIIDSTKKSFDSYAHDIALQVYKLRIDTLGTAIIKLVDSNNITIEVKRVSYLEKARMFVLPDTATLAAKIISNRKKINFQNSRDRIEMATNLKNKIAANPLALYQFTDTATLFIKAFYDKDERLVKIKSIDVLSKKVVSLNDADGDAILDRLPEEDKSKNDFGDFTANGEDDEDLDGVPNNKDRCPNTYGVAGNFGCPSTYYSTKKQVDGYLGFQMNSVEINLPELNQLGYKDESGNDAIRVLESKKGTLKNPRLISSFCGGVDATYFFGKKRKSGLSVGITYTSFKANYLLGDPIVYTYKSFDGTDYYRRQVTIKSLEEEIDYSVINVPVMFNFRPSLGKIMMEFKAGPSLLVFNNRSDYNAVIDIGGIYQIDPSKNEIMYDPYFDATSTYNVYVTSEGINHQSTNPGAASVFSQLSKNYDFETDTDYHDKKKLYRATIGFNAEIEGQSKINDQLAIKVAVRYTFAPLPERNKKYKPIDKTTDEFQSVYNSNAKTNYRAFGVNAGFVYNF